MTEEEIKQKAWEYADKVCGWDKTQMFDYIVDGFIECYKLLQPLLTEKDKQIEELKRKECSSVDCDKAHKNRDFCLGYGGDRDEPCEQCKNCIKCETGYYQLGETEKDKQIEELKIKIQELQAEKTDFLENWYCDHKGGCKVEELEAQIEKMKGSYKL